MKKVQKPTLGRIVIFTAWRDDERVEESAGVVVGVRDSDHGIIDLEDFGSRDRLVGVAFNAYGLTGTWRYPDRCDDILPVDDDGNIVAPW